MQGKKKKREEYEAIEKGEKWVKVRKTSKKRKRGV